MDVLRFDCQPGCTKCCDVEGYVYLTESDLEGAARLLGMAPSEFEARFVYRTRYRMRLRKPRGRQCPFLEESGCGIHPAKPTQCRLFPFWPELVEDRDSWDETARRCPGIGTGRLYQIGTAVEIANEMKTAYPALYGEASDK